jgi:large subunit ribosomal protein L15
VGRGHGTGQGTTAGKGQKGQKARSGGGVPPYFEGGQLPLVRRLPYRRGFKNPFRTEYVPVNIEQLTGFSAGSTVAADSLVAAGILRKGEGPIKLLGKGTLSLALHVRVDRASRQAREKVEAAGGTVEELRPKRTAAPAAAAEEPAAAAQEPAPSRATPAAPSTAAEPVDADGEEKPA